MKKKFFSRIFFFVIFVIIVLILISGCKGKKDGASLGEVRSGSEGLSVSFLLNAPPEKINVAKGEERLNTFEVVLELRNKGAFPQPDDNTPSPLGKIFLSGYDSNILFFEPNPPVIDLSSKFLEGKGTINPNGGLDLATFKGYVNTENLNVDKYEPTLLATACYQYFTIAGPSVCIDPEPYSAINEKKVCNVQDISLTSQGAPVAITKIEEEAFASKTQFRIAIKNVGGGYIIKDSILDKCLPYGEKIERENMDKVYLAEARVGDKSLSCGPFSEGAEGSVKAESGYIRLINGEGSVICELQNSNYAESKTAYTTPLYIKLSYAYKKTAEKKIYIKKELD